MYNPLNHTAMTTISTPMYIDFTRNLNNLKDVVKFEIIMLLERHNLNELTLLPHVRHQHGYTEITTEYIYHEQIVPVNSYCLCGDYETCYTYKLEKRFGVWCICWNDEEDYYNNTKGTHDEDLYKGLAHFQGLPKLDDLILLYNRVYNVLTNPSLFEEENEKVEIEKEYRRKLRERRKKTSAQPQEDTLTALKRELENN